MLPSTTFEWKRLRKNYQCNEHSSTLKTQYYTIILKHSTAYRSMKAWWLNSFQELVSFHSNTDHSSDTRMCKLSWREQSSGSRMTGCDGLTAGAGAVVGEKCNYAVMPYAQWSSHCFSSFFPSPSLHQLQSQGTINLSKVYHQTRTTHSVPPREMKN